MSWSFSAVGTADAVAKAIELSMNNTYSGQSGVEWQQAKPALLILVNANKGGALELRANGSASVTNDVVTSATCEVTVRPLYGFVS